MKLELLKGQPEGIDIFSDAFQQLAAGPLDLETTGGEGFLNLQESFTNSSGKTITITFTGRDFDNSTFENIVFETIAIFEGDNFLGILTGVSINLTTFFKARSDLFNDNNPALMNALLKRVEVDASESDGFDMTKFALFNNNAPGNVIGSNKDDTLLGGDGFVNIDGRGGDDVINVARGNNTLDGGKGNDDIQGGFNVDTIDGGGGSDRIKSGSANDIVNGGNGADDIDGEDGDDNIKGNKGNDNIKGGDGEDTANGGDGKDDVNGGFGNDDLNGGKGDDEVRGNEGDDDVNGGDGDDLVVGDSGNDNVRGNNGNDTLFGDSIFVKSFLFGDGIDDSLFGGKGSDNLIGGDGNDKSFGGGGNDNLFNGKGNDEFTGGSGKDNYLFGSGDGNNVVTDFSEEDGDKIHLEFIPDIANFDDLIGNHVDKLDAADPDAGFIINFQKADFSRHSITVEGVNIVDLDKVSFKFTTDLKKLNTGGKGDDVIHGINGRPVKGRGGDDVILDGIDINAGNGNDIIVSGGGAFSNGVFGGKGNDVIVVLDQGEYFGGAGNDILIVGNGGEATGGGGADEFRAVIDENSAFDQTLLKDFNPGQGDKIDLSHIPDIENFQDLVENHFGIQQIFEQVGDQTIIREFIKGIALGEGGFAGSAPTLLFEEDTFAPNSLSAGNFIFAGSEPPDRTVFNGDTEDNEITGTAAKDVFFGEAGDDFLTGRAGDDVIFGGDGNDNIFGDAGDDTVFGGRGDDSMFGSLGVPGLEGAISEDVFVFNTKGELGHGNDQIIDFSVISDTIDLRGVSDITNFFELLNATENGVIIPDFIGQTGAVITTRGGFNSNSITLVDVDINDLSEDNFIF